MDFIRWCAGKNFTTHPKIALEAIWKELEKAKVSTGEIRRLFDDLHESFEERER